MKNCVIFGGASAEHDISIITGMQLAKECETLNLEKIYLGLDNKFYLATKVKDLSYFNDKNAIKLKEVFILNNVVYSFSGLKKKLFDIGVIINCCHGGVGENGDLAGFFAVNKVKYTSTDSLSAHITMNKYVTKELVKDIVPTIKGELITKENVEEKLDLIKNKFSPDLIVKPNSLGSSIGVKACNKDNFLNQIDAIFTMNDVALVEERVVNMCEFNQAITRIDGKLTLSAIEKPKSKNDILSFDDKYLQSGKGKSTDRELPAKIDNKLKKQIENYSTEIYNKLSLNGVVRIDYIYDLDNKVLYFNEVNTVPGSMSFYLYEPIGIDYITLVENLIKNATIPTQYTYFDTDILNKKKI